VSSIDEGADSEDVGDVEREKDCDNSGCPKTISRLRSNGTRLTEHESFRRRYCSQKCSKQARRSFRYDGEADAGRSRAKQ